MARYLNELDTLSSAASADTLIIREDSSGVDKKITIQALMSAFLPSGTISAFGGAAAPSGYLLCDGSSYLKTEHADLFTAIGTAYGTADGTHFNVPDLRGTFLRGVDGGSGIDPDTAGRTALQAGGNTGDNVGSKQDDAFKSHRHSATIYAGSTSPSVFGRGAATASTAYTNYEGGNESRPINVYVNYIIKT